MNIKRYDINNSHDSETILTKEKNYVTTQTISHTSTSNDGSVVKMLNGDIVEQNIVVVEMKWKLKSSYLNIYKAKLQTNSRKEIIFSPQDIKSKLVCIKHKRELYFIPLLHTV